MKEKKLLLLKTNALKLWDKTRSFFIFIKKIALILFLIILSNQVFCQFEAINHLHSFSGNSFLLYRSFKCQFSEKQNFPDSFYFQASKNNCFEAISNKNGELLFLTNARSVYDKDFKIMEGGQDAIALRQYWPYLGRMGLTHFVIPDSKKENIYYIYYLNNLFYKPNPMETLKGNECLNRIVIDMNENNGFGKVISKDTNMLFFTKQPDNFTHKGFCVAKHSNNKDYWLILSNSDTIKSYLLSSGNLNFNPVESVIPKKYMDKNLYYIMGNSDNRIVFLNADKTCICLKFDNKTGKIDTLNPICDLLSINHDLNIKLENVINIQFSPDKKKVYINYNAIDSLGKLISPLIQLDFSNLDSNFIKKSVKILFNDCRTVGFTTGQDNKIYVNITYLSEKDIYSYVIDSANSPNPIITKVDYAFGWQYYSRSVFTRTSPISKFYISHSCLKEPIKFTLAASKNADSFYWNFGDTFSGINNTSMLKEPEHTYTKPGRYKVILVTVENGIYDTSGLFLCLYDSIKNPNLKDTHLCFSKNILCDALNSGAKYLWSNGDTIQKANFSDTGNFNVEITKGNCKQNFSFKISAKNFSYSLLPSKDTLSCDSLFLWANAPLSSYNYIWSTGNTSRNLILNKSGFYSITAYKNGCTLQDSITAEIISLPIDFLPPDTSACQNQDIFLTPIVDSVNYLWNTGSNNKTIKASNTGLYKLTISLKKCSSADSTYVYFYPLPSPNLGNDKTFCPDKGESITLDGGNYSKWLWLPDNSSERKLTISKPGTYYLFVTDSNGCINSDTINIFEKCDVKFYCPSAFTPNQDGLNDTFNSISEDIIEFNLKIFNRWGEKLFESSNQLQGWDGTFKNKDCPAGVYIFVLSLKFNNGKIFNHSGTLTLLR